MIGAAGQVVEAGPAATTKTTTPPPRGFDPSVPMGGSTQYNQGGDWPSGSRASFMPELRAGYKACVWLSAPIDAVARTITAGGVVVVPDEDADQVFADDPENRPDDGEDHTLSRNEGTLQKAAAKADAKAQGKPTEAMEAAAFGILERLLDGDHTVTDDDVLFAYEVLSPRARRRDDRGQTARDDRGQTARDEKDQPQRDDDGAPDKTPASQQGKPAGARDQQPVDDDGDPVEDQRGQADKRPGGDAPRQPVPPPGVRQLRELLAFVNPHQDIRQLCRGIITDLQIYGDAFLELVWLLGKPVAIYSLDSASMTVLADEHGTVTGYLQDLGDVRKAEFQPHQVIHIQMDSPDGSLYGLGVAQKALLPVTVWLYAVALLRQRMKMGDPPSIHVDHAIENDEQSVRRWREQYRAGNLGIDNLGQPITTIGGGTVAELQTGALKDLLETLCWARDTILSECGVPPAKVGIIESGNLGGGTGTSQDKTFRVNTCGPIDQLVMEKLNYALLPAFGIQGWSMAFEDVDWRDDKELEEIRDLRIRNGAWTLNTYLADIGEPLVDPEFGDEHVILPHQPQAAILWADIPASSGAAVDQAVQAAKPQAAAGVPSVDKNGNPVPPGHPSQVPPNHPAAQKAVQDEKDRQAEQLAVTAKAAAAGAPGSDAGPAKKDRAREAWEALVAAHAVHVLEQAGDPA